MNAPTLPSSAPENPSAAPLESAPPAIAPQASPAAAEPNPHPPTLPAHESVPVLVPPESIPKPQSTEAAGQGANADGNRASLLEACLMMLKLTGGSRYWTGDTQTALEFMEAAVAEALGMRQPRPPQTVVPPPPPALPSSPAHSVTAPLVPFVPFCGNSDPSAMASARLLRTGASAVVPEITASVPATVGCGLQMAGVEAPRWRSAV